ncbi:MAG TPA: hypothetical protein PK847_13695 [Candidatus Sumerlaeota bacterium]|nr:hypothetical protein [Candidatus Sumerlaeota bacterium]HOR27911.1 hypothetical protein [Candidatus Sumerlaeota bacterium]
MTFTIEYEQEDDGRWLGSHASHDDQDLRERTWSLPFLLIDHFVCDEICHSKRKPSSRACPTTVKKKSAGIRCAGGPSLPSIKGN